MNIPKDLIQKMRNENVILFVGSGFSNNANLPLWNTLLNQIIDNYITFSDASEKSFYKSMDYLQKGQFIYDKIGKATVVEYMQNEFRKSEKVSIVHEMISQLPIKTFVTTNYDTLLEDYIKKSTFKDCAAIWKDTQITTTTSSRVVLKLHGDINDPDSIVFSEDDYLKNIINRTALKNYFSALLASRTFLFIGYSYNDINLKLLIEFIYSRIYPITRKMYFFIPNSSRFHCNYLTNRGFEVISYSKKTKTDSTFSFMKDLIYETSITAKDKKQRLQIILRENSAFVESKAKLQIRNRSSLGPLATPLEPKNKNIFENEEFTRLEILCAKNWIKLISLGSTAKCIICLNKDYLLQKNNPDNLKERLITLKDNIINLNDKLVVVYTETPTHISKDIYGNRVLLESRKTNYVAGGYSRINVLRDHSKIEEEIEEFDLSFNEILQSYQMNNLTNQQMNSRTVSKIESIIEFIESSN